MLLTREQARRVRGTKGQSVEEALLALAAERATARGERRGRCWVCGEIADTVCSTLQEACSFCRGSRDPALHKRFERTIRSRGRR